MTRSLPLLALLLAACAGGPVDEDGDGFDSEVDCDDLDSGIFPGATEVCDEVDNDCGGDTDEPTAADALLWYVDSDGDGYGDPERFAKACDQPAGWVDNGDDCDDEDATVHEGC